MSDARPMLECTLVIPTYNEASRIGTVLSSALSSALPPTCEWRRWVVLDDASSDATVQVINQWMNSNEGPPIDVLISEERQGKAPNLARFHSSLLSNSCNEELVVICDADVKILRESFMELLTPFADDDKLGVSWGVDVPDSCSFGHWAASFQKLAAGRAVLAAGLSAPQAYGRFFAYRVGTLSAFNWVGGLVTDDNQLRWYLERSGVPCLLNPNAIVEVTLAGNWWDFYLQTHRYYAAEARVTDQESAIDGPMAKTSNSEYQHDRARWKAFVATAMRHPLMAASYVIARAVALYYHKCQPARFEDKWQPPSSTKG